MPNFEEEKICWKAGHKIVVGLDEAGRGPLAGPVVAAAVTFPAPFGRGSPSFIGRQFSKINDSKKLSEIQREKAYDFLVNSQDVVFGVGIVSEKIIDKINILQATKLAMEKAVENLQKKLVVQKIDDRQFSAKVDFLLIDGNFKINSQILQKSIVKGDQKVFSIAASSIIAKVTRDRLMQKYHKKYPKFGFGWHKGYATSAHIAALRAFGPCKIHRKSFYPIRGS